MADSTPIKPEYSPREQVGDVPDRSNPGDVRDNLRVGDVHEEDAIDRLLDGDNFRDTEDMADFFAAALHDEADLPSIAIVPDRAGPHIVADTAEPAAEDLTWVDDADEIVTPEMTALERVAHVAEFPQPAAFGSDDAAETLRADQARDIPGRPAASAPASRAEPAVTANPERDAATAAAADPAAAETKIELAMLFARLAALEGRLQALEQDVGAKTDRQDLEKFRHDLTRPKPQTMAGHGRDGSGRSTSAIAAYTANVVAVIALLLAVLAGFSNSDLESQIGELQQRVARLQELAEAEPAEDSTEQQEQIQKQLEELKIADSQTAVRLAEISKVVQKSSASAKVDAALNKKMAVLDTQNQQVDARIDELQHRISDLKKNSAPPAPPVSKPDPRKTADTGNWTVDLIAFKQDWVAKSKADEYAGKGIPVRIHKTEAKGVNWYWLSVEGFNSQAEAAAYATKMRKSLNLESIGISHHPD